MAITTVIQVKTQGTVPRTVGNRAIVVMGNVILVRLPQAVLRTAEEKPALKAVHALMGALLRA